MSYQQADDERERADAESLLIARSQQGDRRAFNELVVRHQSGAYALALRMLGDAEAAADVTQDAFLSAFRALGSLRGVSFRAWLYRIVSNGCYDHWRAQGRRPASSLESLLDGGDEEETRGASADALLAQATPDPAWDPERVVLRAEVVEEIQLALLKLPDEQRLAVILSDVQGLPYEEIARAMNTSLGTVKSRISRARAHLRKLLMPNEELFGLSRRPDNERESREHQVRQQ